MKKSTVVFVAIASAFTALPALAAADACLQINRIYSSNVVDRTTILIIDITNKQYTVHMRGACIGLDKTAEKLTFRTKTQLGCLTSGDSISYNRPGERTPVAIRGSMQTPCFVDHVTEGAPPSHAG
jgi:hypothetical protein